MPTERQKADQEDEVNWEPWSEATVAGTPKQEIHHSEHVCVALYRRQRNHQVDIDVGETSRRLGRSLLTTWKPGSVANAAVVEHAACMAESALVSWKGGTLVGARHES